MIREEIVNKAKKIKADKEEKVASKKTTDTGEKPDKLLLTQKYGQSLVKSDNKGINTKE